MYHEYRIEGEYMKLVPLNNKGFAMAGVLYPLLILFLMLLLGVIGTITGRKILLDKTKKEVQSNLDGSSTYTYVKDGLIGSYTGYVGPEKKEGIYYWQDQSGKKNDGIMREFNYTNESQNGSLIFTGKQYVKLPVMNYQQITIEAVVKRTGDVETGYNLMSVVANTETGGYGLEFRPQQQNFTFQVCVNGNYISAYDNSAGSNLYHSPSTEKNKLTYLSGSYNNETAVFYQDGIKYSTPATGTTCYPTNNAYMAVGANPMGSDSVDGGVSFKGNIYAVRIYNRALTDEEVAHNYKIDQKKYQMFQ